MSDPMSSSETISVESGELKMFKNIYSFVALALTHLTALCTAYKCVEWTSNYTSTICENVERPPVKWYEGEIPDQLDEDAFCCEWTFTKSGSSSSSSDPCEHSICTSSQITISSGNSAEAKCATPEELQVVGYIVIGVLSFLLFVLCLVGICVFFCCINPAKKNQAANANDATSAQGIAIAVPVKN